MSETTTRSPTLQEVIRQAVEYFLEDVHVSLPGRVESYDPVTQKVDVKPLIKRRLQTQDGTELLEEIPIIPDVPMVFPRSAGFFITFPIKRGDHVMLVFQERSIDKWLEQGGVDTDPGDFRRHDLTDAVALPGMYPLSKALQDINTDDMEIGEEGGSKVTVESGAEIEIRLKGDGNVSIIPSGSGKVHVGADTGDEPISMADKTDGRFTALETYLISVLATWANTHQHFYIAPLIPLPGPPILTTPPNTPPLVPHTPGTSVASSKSTTT